MPADLWRAIWLRPVRLEAAAPNEPRGARIGSAFELIRARSAPRPAASRRRGERVAPSPEAWLRRGAAAAERGARLAEEPIL
jgi:hypothetical protein